MDRARGALASVTATLAAVFGATQLAIAQPARSGRDIFDSACAACHGSDGRGGPAVAADYPVAPPDFTDCNFATREPSADWLSVVHGGGPVRGFSRLMPSFRDALSTGELELAISHVRTFCTDGEWPRGELNLPRALVTTKAYPEDEAVVTVGASEGAVRNTFVFERRFGARNHFEVIAPLALSERSPGGWTGGVGDLALAYKRVLAHDLPGGRILSVAGELVVPTGSTERGLGAGATVVEPMVMYGQLLPGRTFVQLQVGAGVPFERERADELFWRTVVGRRFTQGRYGRAWSPMVEVLGARDLVSEVRTRWDLVPEMQISLNTRQHVMLNAGVRIPVSDRAGRSSQLLVYLLWDWFDGGLLQGW
jgi:hypothetical protein